jgi:hypothetical protein
MNVEGLTVEIQRCPDGVQLVDLVGTGLYDPEAVGTVAVAEPPAKRAFRYRTDRRETQTLTICDLEDPVVIAFVKATDNERRQFFFGRFGLDSLNGRILWGNELLAPAGWREELRYDDVIGMQFRFRRLLQHVGGEDPAAAMAAINSSIAEDKFNLQPTFHLAGPRGTPRLLLKSETLLAFMSMEVAMMAAHDVRITECEKCGEIFLTGTLTWRRSHARFCSDRCRVAAMRARQAADT